MSQLSPFVRAFKALGHALEAVSSAMEKSNESLIRAEVCSDTDLVPEKVLAGLGESFLAAAAELEQQIAADAARFQRQPVEEPPK